MKSSEGEIVELKEVISTSKAHGQVEKWSLELESVMAASVHKVIVESMVDYKVKRHVFWVRSWMRQAVLVVTMLFWTQFIHKFIVEGQKALETYLQLNNNQINEIVGLARGKLSEQNRVTLEALVDILFGDYNPGAKNNADYGTDVSPTFESNYTEGVFLDYRHFDKYSIVPRFHFGFGLSYTTFSFANLDISKAEKSKHSASLEYQKRRMRPYTNFAASKIFDPVYEITFTITNTGKVDGSEVPQLYLGFPTEAEEPPKVLRGFEKVFLVSGESKQISLVLTQKDISYWNVINQKWTIASGSYTVWISTSANNADVKLQGSFNV